VAAAGRGNPTQATGQAGTTTPNEERGALHRTDADLIAASGKDPHAFAGLFDRHYDVIAGWLRRRVEHALADELASETFLQAFAARARYDAARADARPWLFGIAANLLRRHRRAEERRWRAYARAATRAVDEADLGAVDARLDAGAAASALATALASLGPGERDVLLLYAWAELSYEQIADALALPIGTVRSRLHRARGVARELIERSGEAAGDTVVAAAAATGREEPR
jgi:RNA polymerase sigma factor (sigma-70 family)